MKANKLFRTRNGKVLPLYVEANMKKYLNVETDGVWTERELREEYNRQLMESEIDPEIYADFNYWLNSCLTINNGSLMEISDEDAMIVSVDTVYHTQGRYGEISHTGKHYLSRIYNLKMETANGHQINWSGVNGVIINEDDSIIFQASGYTQDRGLFCDLY